MSTIVSQWPRFFCLSGLSSSQQVMLQLVALCSMTIAHTLLIFDDGSHWFRSFSRFVYPAFAYLAAFNYLYRARNKTKYLKRLLLWACISQPLYSWALEISIFKLNILFTLALGLAFVYCCDFILKKIHTSPVISMLCSAVLFMVLMVLGYFVSFYWFGITLLAAFILYFRAPTFPNLTLVFINIILLNVFITGFNQGLYGLLFFLLVFSLIKHTKNVTLKRPPSLLLYVYYPSHFLILGLLHAVV